MTGDNDTNNNFVVHHNKCKLNDILLNIKDYGMIMPKVKKKGLKSACSFEDCEEEITGKIINLS